MVRTDEEGRRRNSMDNGNTLPATDKTGAACKGVSPGGGGLQNNSAFTSASHLQEALTCVHNTAHIDDKNDNVLANGATKTSSVDTGDLVDIMSKSTIENNNDISKVDNEQYQQHTATSALASESNQGPSVACHGAQSTQKSPQNTGGSLPFDACYAACCTCLRNSSTPYS